MVTLLNNFSLTRMADKYGPKQLLLLIPEPGMIAALLLTRTNKKVQVDSFECFPLHKSEDEHEQPIITKILKHKHFHAQYCSIIMREQDEQIRILKAQHKSSSTADINRYLAESFGGGTSFSYRHQLLPQVGDQRMLLGSQLNTDLIDSLKQLIENAGVKPVSLTMESVAIINMVLKVCTEGTQAFFHIGSLNSVLVVTNDKNLCFIRTFPHGKNSIIDSLSRRLDITPHEANELFLSDEQDFSDSIDQDTRSWMHQLAMSLDYVERDASLSVDSVRVLGIGSKSRCLQILLHEQVYRDVLAVSFTSIIEQLIVDDIPPGMDDFLIPLYQGATTILGELINES